MRAKFEISHGKECATRLVESYGILFPALLLIYLYILIFLEGIESIRKVLEQCKTDKKNSDLVDGYHGLLIDNIKCDKSLYTAVETAVGGRLFYHIVDTDAICMRLLKIFNQQRLPGDVNYYPLNVLKLESNNIKYPETQDAIPLISKVKYEAKMDKAIHSVFDRVLLCRNAEIATQLAKQTKMDCVLLDGDFISRKGKKLKNKELFDVLFNFIWQSMKLLVS